MPNLSADIVDIALVVLGKWDFAGTGACGARSICAMNCANHSPMALGAVHEKKQLMGAVFLQVVSLPKAGHNDLSQSLLT